MQPQGSKLKVGVIFHKIFQSGNSFPSDMLVSVSFNPQLPPLIIYSADPSPRSPLHPSKT